MPSQPSPGRQFRRQVVDKIAVGSYLQAARTLGIKPKGARPTNTNTGITTNARTNTAANRQL
jgi:hypothetical protein